MLPSSAGVGRQFNSSLIPEYVWRFFHFRHLSFDLACACVVDLLIRPREVANTAKMRKQIKNQWARDDPAFVLILAAMILITTIAYCVAFQTTNIVHILRLTIGGVLFEFILGGCAIATCVRWYLNAYMRVHRIHTVEQTIEWLYAFDVHCNALFVSFLLISVSQYCLMPVVTANGFIATAMANTIWTAGIGYYCYITFLGYSALPFLDRPDRLFYPMGVVLCFYFLFLLLNVNMSRCMLDLYFGHAHAAAEGGGDGE